MSFSRGSVLIQLGRYTSAEQEYRALLGTNPNDASAHALLSHCLSKQKRFVEAVDAAKTAISLRPDLCVGYSALGSVCMLCGRIDEGIAAIDLVIALNARDANSFGILAVLRLKQRRFKATLSAANAGLEIDPDHVGCLNLRGIALTRLQRFSEAIASDLRALDRHPESGLIHANLGWALLSSRNRRAAIEHFREALRIDPNLRWAKGGLFAAMDSRTLLNSPFIRGLTKWLSQLIRLGAIGVPTTGKRFARSIREHAARLLQRKP